MLSISLESRHSSDLVPPVTIESPPPPGQPQPTTAETGNETDLSELLQRLFYLENIVRYKFGVQNLDLQALRALASEAQQDASIGSGGNMAPGRGIAAVDEKCSIQPIEHNVAHFSGEHSHWNFSMQIKRWIKQNISLNARIPVEGLTEFWRFKDLQCLSSTLAAVSSLPPRFIADFLIHCFFKHAMTNYFYVDRDWLFTKLDTAYSSSSSLGQNDAGTMCTIFCIFAIGTHYAHLEANDGDTTGSFTHHPSNVTPFTGESASLVFYHEACRLLPDVITIASLESVQACLILAVFALPLDASGLAWTYLGLASKLAVLNGADVSVNQHSSGAATPSPLSCVEATLRLNEMLNRSSLKRFSCADALHWGLDRLSQSQGELVAWWDCLPTSLSRPELSSSTLDIRPIAHLKLEYCLVRMFIGRNFLFPEECLRSEIMDSMDCRDPGSSASLMDPNILKSHFIDNCVDAALGAIETCRFLKNTIGLARASYTEFSSCRAALLIIAIQCFQTGSRKYRHSLREGLIMLKEMASWAELARVEASLIDAFEKVLINMDATQNEISADESGFMEFKRWENMWKENTSATDSFNLVGQDGMAQMTDPSWQDWPNIRESTSLNLDDIDSFPMLEPRGQRGLIHQPRTCEDLSTLLGFSFQSS
ncbi:hypothetical protein LT330_004398 [Penicillium expansum]|nr:hypothetical protein LT330_004398 [Penicillium expansum]